MKTSNRGFKKVPAIRITNKQGERVWFFEGKEFPSQRDLRDYIIKETKKVSKDE